MIDQQNDLILIRHAQSTYNKGYNQYIAENNLTGTWQEMCLDHNFRDKMLFDPQYIDSKLTQKGKGQCQMAKKALQQTNIDIVLVSPHYRALQTCRQIFRERKVRVEVHPVFAQGFKYVCDINVPLQISMQQFKQYDFENMKGKRDLWCIDELAERHQSTWKQRTQNKYLTFEEKQLLLLKLLKQGTIQQSDHQLRQRVWRVKTFLNQYRQKYNKIAVVSHFYLLQHLVCQAFDSQSRPIDPLQIENAVPIYRNIAKLSQFK